MFGPLSGLALPDHLTTALENRAYREGVVKAEHYRLSKIRRPRLSPPSADEHLVLDTLCLYDGLVLESRRFEIDPINHLAGKKILEEKPQLVRGATLAIAGLDVRLNVDGSKFDLDNIILKYFGITDNTPGGRALAVKRLNELRALAAREARYFLERDLAYYISDAKLEFEEEGGIDSLFSSVEVNHFALLKFFRDNMYWLIDHIDAYHVDGVHNNYIDEIENWPLPRGVRQVVFYYTRSQRFYSYLRFLEDTYTSIFETAFASRFLGIEVAYERAPTAILSTDHPLARSAASQVIRINLADLAEYFPLPRCLEEAVEIREHPKMLAFRGALDRWLIGVDGAEAAEAKLRREVTIANRDLGLLKRWKKLKEHPIYFGVKTAASFVPGVGLPLKAFDVLAYFG